MINILKNTIYILNFLILVLIIIFTSLFYFQTKITFLSNFIVIITIITLFLKLLYWHLIKRPTEMVNSINKSNIFLLRITFCILTYITPAYYILQQPSLVVNNYVISITLIIISILIFVGILVERYLFFIESNLTAITFFENNNNLK